MVKPEWGKKRLCQSCGIKYYDMMRDPIICPKCGSEYEEPVKQPRRGRTPKAAKTPETGQSVIDESLDKNEVISSDIDEVINDSDDDIVIEDTSELDDEDDVSIVLDGIETKNGKES
ncbi:MAG: TIGR02300 family protein [Alphaproteobacteria bacterium]|nr:TIGR02300 family protein [Alphaproteobacteria bacterium]